MGIATHLGPWLLGTVRSTTGTTAGTIRNLGVTTVAQTATVNMSGVALTASALPQALFTLPAGSKILRLNAEYTTAASGGGVTAISMVVGNGTGSNNQLFTATSIGISAGKVAQATIDATMQVVLTNNIGTVDYPVFATFAATTGNPTAGTLVLTCEYLVRNPDGTIYPTAFTGP